MNADVLVLDLLMPGLGGLDVAREVARCFAKTRIFVLSMHSSELIPRGVAGAAPALPGEDAR
jgi:two-component system invasion response regulator UvrY